MVNHDDGEFVDAEKDGASLAAARGHGRAVVGMKADWKHMVSAAVSSRR